MKYLNKYFLVALVFTLFVRVFLDQDSKTKLEQKNLVLTAELEEARALSDSLDKTIVTLRNEGAMTLAMLMTKLIETKAAEMSLDLANGRLLFREIQLDHAIQDRDYYRARAYVLNDLLVRERTHMKIQQLHCRRPPSIHDYYKYQIIQMTEVASIN